MKKVSSSLKAMFTSWKITLILLVHYVILLAAATFVEKAQGTAMAREIIYNNPLFYLLQFLLILNFCFLVLADTRYCHLSGRMGKSAMLHLTYLAS